MRSTANAWTKDWHKRVTILTVMQNAENEMALEYRGGRLRSVLPPGVEPVPVHLPQADAAGQAVAKVSGGTAYTTVLESLFGGAPQRTSWAGRCLGRTRHAGWSMLSTGCSDMRACA